MDLNKIKNKAKDLVDDAREKAEDLAEKGIDMVEEKTGKEVPDAVKSAVDKIDDGDNA